MKLPPRLPAAAAFRRPNTPNKAAASWRPADFAQARSHLEQAVQGGDAGAACHLGEMTLKGQGGLKADQDAAAKLFQLGPVPQHHLFSRPASERPRRSHQRTPMNFRHIAVASSLIGGLWITGTAQAQGFVFGTADPKAAPAAPAGARNSKVESAQRLLARIGLLRETPSGTLTPGHVGRHACFRCAHRPPRPPPRSTKRCSTAIRRHIWTSQNWSSGNYKGKEKIVDAQGLREAQILLGKLGFNAGPLDGTFGPQTQVATEAFQESQSVSVGRSDHLDRSDEPAPSGERSGRRCQRNGSRAQLARLHRPRRAARLREGIQHPRGLRHLRGQR